MAGYRQGAWAALALYLGLMTLAASMWLLGLSSPWYVTALAFWGLIAFNLLHSASIWGWRGALGFATWAGLVTWVAEAIGVTWGWPFGRYRYQAPFLGPHVGPVPLLVPVAWYSVAYAAWHMMVRGTTWSRPGLRALAASWALTAWDLLADPVLVARGMWVWEQPGAYFGIPLSNYAGWLWTGWVLFYGWERWGLRFFTAAPQPSSQSTWQDRAPWVAYTGIGVMYVLLAVAVGQSGAALAGGMAMGSVALWSWRSTPPLKTNLPSHS